MKDKRKVVVIGLDGANINMINTIGIKFSGLLSELLSTIPPYTPPSWTSIITGVNPGKHGIIGWQKVNIKKNLVTFNTSEDVMYPRLPEMLSISGLKSIMINLPISYPFQGIKYKENTVIVSDWAAPKQLIYPERLTKKYQMYLVKPPSNWDIESNKKEYIKRILEYLDVRLNLYYDLLEKHRWNLFFIVFSETDWISHLFPQILEGRNTVIVSPILKKIKKFIESAIDISDIMLIVSDHGFEVKTKLLYVNEILLKNGFIKIDKTRAYALGIIKKLAPDKIVKMLLQKKLVQGSRVMYNTDLRATKAFMIEPATWGIYLKEDSLKIRNKLKRVFKEIREIKEVIFSKNIYQGPYTNVFPPVIIIPEKGISFSHKFKGMMMEEIYKGDHEIHGVIGVTGENICVDPQIRNTPKVYDIVPTILHIFGLPIPKDTDGRVLTEIFKDGSEYLKRKPTYIDISYYKSIKSRLRMRIRKLKSKEHQDM